MALTKIITPGAQDFGEPQTQQVKLSRKGLVGADLDAFVKRASIEFVDKMASIRFGKGEVPVHMIAMTAGEYYGGNRNADFWSSKDLQKKHDTFVKHAKHYRDHANKNPAKSYGVVKASAYNDRMHRVELIVALNATKEAAERNGGLVADKEMEKLAKDGTYAVSMACVLDPEYPVLTRDRGYVDIADIVVGDYVWTHRGRWQRVKQLNRRVYSGAVHTFSINGHPFPLAITADHPMWAKVFEGSRTVDSIKQRATRYFKDPEAFAAAPAGWTHAEHIGIGDRFFYKPVGRYGGYGAIDCCDLAALMGYYLAEGSLAYNCRTEHGENVGRGNACTVNFSCHIDDSATRNIPAIIERLYPDITIKIKPHHTSDCAVALHVHSTHLAQFMRKFIRTGCRQKLIPPEIFNADREVKLSFIGAWLDGDGWLDKKGTHWSTASKNLVLQGRDLLASVGIPSSIYCIDHSKCATSGKVNSGIEYTLNVSHLDAWQFTEYSEKAANYVPPTTQRTKPSCMRFCPDNTYAFRIKDVEVTYVSEQPTYNVEVEEDESYSLGGLISHNCQVPFDICMACGNKAKTRAEYCGPEQCTKYGGCKDNLGKTFEDGFTLCVDNPNPKFFDISHVYRPADRIAYVLGTVKQAADYENLMKEAAEHYGEQRSSNYLAERLGVTPPIWLMADNPWSDPRIVNQLKVANELIQLEADTANQAPTPQDSAFNVALRPETVNCPDVVTGPYKLAHVTSALAAANCMLPLGTFLTLLTGDYTPKTAAAVDAVAARLPGVYTRLADDPRLEEDLRTNPYLPTGPIPRKIKHWVTKNAAYWSMSRPRVVERLQRAVIRGMHTPQPRRTMLKVATLDNAEQLAKQYALYQLGFLTACKDEPDAKFTRELAIRSNFVA
jgi:hypothetical protein